MENPEQAAMVLMGRPVDFNRYRAREIRVSIKYYYFNALIKTGQKLNWGRGILKISPSPIL